MGFSKTTLRRLNALDDLKDNADFGPEYVKEFLEDYVSKQDKRRDIPKEVSDFVGRKFKIVTFPEQENYRTTIFFSSRAGRPTKLKRGLKWVLDLPWENEEDARNYHNAIVKYLEDE